MPCGSGPLSVRIWDHFGTFVRLLLDEPSPEPGKRVLYWDGTDRAGRSCPDGYFIWRVTIGSVSSSRLVLFRRSADAEGRRDRASQRMPVPKRERFGERIGSVFLPLAEHIVPIVAEQKRTLLIGAEAPSTLIPAAGCYALEFSTTGAATLGSSPTFRGTFRVEPQTVGVRISGDLYRSKAIAALAEIPIYPRDEYYSYWKGIAATAGSNARNEIQLTVEEYRYAQSATGFSGTFSDSPSRTLRLEVALHGGAGGYEGGVFVGQQRVGTVRLNFVSKSFRRASVVIHPIPGAATPTSVTSSGGELETYQSIYDTVGWNLSVTEGPPISMPPSLIGVQNPDACWSQVNLAELLSNVPGYDAAELDSVWKVHLLAVSGRLGCGRGEMFDVGPGDPNNIPREASVTFSDDGFPADETPNYGAVANKRLRDIPRAFLRSAAHEIGHAFNQIHQNFESGIDNSIMTPTNGVADAIAAGGGTFPEGIYLGFNDRVRQHLIHLPDPAVRPGAIQFYGDAISAPQADAVDWPEELELQLNAARETLMLSEPLILCWTLVNRGKKPLPVPQELGTRSLIARISVTDPDDEITFVRPPDLQSCPHIRFVSLSPGETRSSEAKVFWGTDGFAFDQPGRHLVEVMLLWSAAGQPIAVSATAWIWVNYPINEQENQVAHLMLHPEVGCAVAVPRVAPSGEALRRLRTLFSTYPKHPACACLGSVRRWVAVSTENAPSEARSAALASVREGVDRIGQPKNAEGEFRKLQWKWIASADKAELLTDAAGATDPFLESFLKSKMLPPSVPNSNARGELVHILRAAAEVEHALMVQYLYAYFSSGTDDDGTRVPQFLMIAKQEMGHLFTMQNMLRAIGEDVHLVLPMPSMPEAQYAYPFPLVLQPPSIQSLAQYVTAESPLADILPEPWKTIATNAIADAAIEVRHVGILYLKLYWLFQPSSAQFGPWTPPLSPDWETVFGNHHLPNIGVAIENERSWNKAWDVAMTDPNFLETADKKPLFVAQLATGVPSQNERACRALYAIGTQGEGWIGDDTHASHFKTFANLYQSWKTTGLPTSIIKAPVNPWVGEPSTDSQMEARRITDSQASLLARAFNLRYERILLLIALTFTPEAQEHMLVALLRSQALGEMGELVSLADALLERPLKQGDSGTSLRAGPPFQAPPAVPTAFADIRTRLTSLKSETEMLGLPTDVVNTTNDVILLGQLAQL